MQEGDVGVIFHWSQSEPVCVQVFTSPAVVFTLLVHSFHLEPDYVQVEECSGNEGATMEC